MKKTILILLIVVFAVTVAVFALNPDSEPVADITEEENTQAPYDLVSALQKCESLGDIVNETGISSIKYIDHKPEIFCTDYWCRYKEEGKEDIIYSICVQTMTELAEFLTEHSDKPALDRKSETGEKLTFEARIGRAECEIYFCNDGYLYISCDGITKAFNIGKEAYEDYYDSLIAVVWTPENPVTLG